MPILTKIGSLETTVEQVKCPFDALKIDGRQCVCVYPFKISNKNVGPVNLGGVSSDIIEHCSKCSFKNQKETKREVKLLPITNNVYVACPMRDGLDVSVVDSCKTCIYKAGKEMKEHYMKDGNKDIEIDKLFCHYPNIPSYNLKLSLTENEKKSKLHGVINKGQ